jgi:hypothetical protein
MVGLFELRCSSIGVILRLRSVRGGQGSGICRGGFMKSMPLPLEIRSNKALLTSNVGGGHNPSPPEE